MNVLEISYRVFRRIVVVLYRVAETSKISREMMRLARQLGPHVGNDRIDQAP